MKIINEAFGVSSTKRCDMIDVTSQVEELVCRSGITDGDVIVFCPHTTAGITINENADPSVVSDMLFTLEKLIPAGLPQYRHMEGNSDSHVKSSLTGCSEQIIIKNGKPLLGTWQGIYFCEFDGPRNRTVFVQIRG